MPPITLMIMLHVPLSGISEFRAYEDQVLPLLERHGGILERRLRNADGTVELHIVRFESHAHFERFRSDPDRTAHASLFAASGAVAEIIEMSEV